MPRMVIEREGNLSDPHNISGTGMEELHDNQKWVVDKATELAKQGWLIEEELTVTSLGDGAYKVSITMNTDKGEKPIL
jgi:hypothetical protein